MNPDLVDFHASFEDVFRAEFYTEIAALASLIDYEDVDVPKLQPLRR
jgi:hypothetical protein